MLEIAPGVYTSPKMTRGVRDRVIKVLEEWWNPYKNGSILVTWKDKSLSGGQAVLNFGLPPKEIIAVDGILLAKSVSSS